MQDIVGMQPRKLAAPNAATTKFLNYLGSWPVRERDIMKMIPSVNSDEQWRESRSLKLLQPSPASLTAPSPSPTAWSSHEYPVSRSSTFLKSQKRAFDVETSVFLISESLQRIKVWYVIIFSASCRQPVSSQFATLLELSGAGLCSRLSPRLTAHRLAKMLSSLPHRYVH